MKKIYAGDMTRLEFAERIKEAKCVIVTAGSCEQHGYHMALDTDNVLGHYMAMEAAKRTDSIVMPNINYGQVWSARNFPGSISLSNDTLKAVFKEIIISLENFGARNILLLAGHNGNAQAMKDVARELVTSHGYRNVWYYQQSVNKDLCKQYLEWRCGLIWSTCPNRKKTSRPYRRKPSIVLSPGMNTSRSAVMAILPWQQPKKARPS